MKSVTIKDVVVCCMKPSCIVIFIVVWRWFVSGGAGSEDNGVVTRLTAVLLELVGIWQLSQLFQEKYDDKVDILNTLSSDHVTQNMEIPQTSTRRCCYSNLGLIHVYINKARCPPSPPFQTSDNILLFLTNFWSQHKKHMFPFANGNTI